MTEEMEDTDFCYECDTTTVWHGEVCSGCGRVWGYPLSDGERLPVTAPDENHGPDRKNAVAGLMFVMGCWALFLLAVAIPFIIGWICR